MFKKKSNLPPRPKCPSTDQIIEDLCGITNNDPMLKAAKLITEKKLKFEGNQEQDTIYQKIKQFFVKHEDLQEKMKNLQILNDDIKEKEMDLSNFAEDLKEQVLKALI